MPALRRNILRAFATLAVATLAVLIIRGRDPEFLYFHRATPAEAAMDRDIDELSMDCIPLNQALEILSSKAGVRIAFGDPNSFSITSPKDLGEERFVTLHAQHITGADALAMLIQETGDPLECDVHSDGVLIEEESPGRVAGHVFDVYDLNPIIAGGPAPSLKAAPVGGVATVYDAMFEDDLSRAIHVFNGMPVVGRGVVWGATPVSYGNGSLLLLATPGDHRRLARFGSFRGAAAGAAAPSSIRFTSLRGSRWRAPIDEPAEVALRAAATPGVWNARRLEDVLADIAQLNHLRLSVNWRELEGSGIDRDAPVTASASGQPLVVLLRQILDSIGSTARFDFAPYGHWIEITRAGSSRMRFTRCYDLRESFANLNSARRDHLRDSIHRQLINIPEPGSWDGLTDGYSFEFIGPNLIVTTDWEAQEAVEKWLNERFAPDKVETKSLATDGEDRHR